MLQLQRTLRGILRLDTGAGTSQAENVEVSHHAYCCLASRGCLDMLRLAALLTGREVSAGHLDVRTQLEYRDGPLSPSKQADVLGGIAGISAKPVYVVASK